MIVPMKKYSFLVYHKEYIEFLKGLQDLGVLHIIERGEGEIEDEELRLMHSQITELNGAIKFLSKREIEPVDNSSESDGLKILEEVKSLWKDQESQSQQLQSIQKEKTIIEPWGDFSWENIDRLKESNLQIKFFTCSLRTYKSEWEDEYSIEQINQLGDTLYFVAICKPDEEINISAEEIRLPKKSLGELNHLIDEINEISEKTEDIFNDFAANYLKLLESKRDELSGRLMFDKVVLNTQKEAEERLMILEGWVPTDVENEIVSYLEKSGIYFEAQSPEIKEDAPPIKLKNNRFAKLYESIGELYTFPDYKEIDLTPFFAPFYMLFFGFCLGDAGYGLLITLGTIYGLFKAKAKFKPLMKLGMFLGIATTFMGIVGGTFFGIMLHPENHEAGTTFAPWIMKYQEYIVSSDNLMVAALVIGYFQVVFGMFINAANRMRLYGFKFAISQLGWNIIALVTVPAALLTFFVEFLNPQVGKQIILVSGIIGGLPAFFYNTPGKNPLLNFGTGLWQAYQVASGLLGDVLSYIRLFALGLSSAILGNVFNKLALQSSEGVGGGVVGILFMLIILAFGHGLNFFMAALGSFVHPLRLTFVEFYKNAGFAGGGKKYEPFSN